MESPSLNYDFMAAHGANYTRAHLNLTSLYKLCFLSVFFHTDKGLYTRNVCFSLFCCCGCVCVVVVVVFFFSTLISIRNVCFILFFFINIIIFIFIFCHFDIWRKVVPGKEGHPSNRVNFSERLYEKKVDPFAQANSARACSDCLALTELTRLGGPKCLYGEKLARLGG